MCAKAYAAMLPNGLEAKAWDIRADVGQAAHNLCNSPPPDILMGIACHEQWTVCCEQSAGHLMTTVQGSSRRANLARRAKNSVYRAFCPGSALSPRLKLCIRLKESCGAQSQRHCLCCPFRPLWPVVRRHMA